MTARKSYRQTFVIERAPECEPVDAKRIERLLAVDRPDSEWAVAEMELVPARLVDVRVAEDLPSWVRGPR